MSEFVCECVCEFVCVCVRLRVYAEMGESKGGGRGGCVYACMRMCVCVSVQSVKTIQGVYITESYYSYMGRGYNSPISRSYQPLLYDNSLCEGQYTTRPIVKGQNKKTTVNKRNTTVNKKPHENNKNTVQYNQTPRFKKGSRKVQTTEYSEQLHTPTPDR